jgi:hypothetical protein
MNDEPPHKTCGFVGTPEWKPFFAYMRKKLPKFIVHSSQFIVYKYSSSFLKLFLSRLR